MCVGEVSAEGHRCIDACPACYIFTPNSCIRLLSGETLRLGDVDLFVEVARVGCRMCEMLVNMWSLDEEVKYKPINPNTIFRLTSIADLPVRS